MSGFDFDALRDPEAPLPGRRERDGVNLRARQMRARQLRNRVTITTTAFVIVAGAVVGLVAAQRDNGPEISVPGVSTSQPATPTTAGPSIEDRFIPPTTVENGKVVLPVTQPDGSTFTIRYPPDMHIAELGFSGGIDIDWPTIGSQFAQISYTNIQRVYGDAKPVATYAGAGGGRIGLYDVPFPAGTPPPQGPRPTQELAFQFGPWLVRMYTSSPSKYSTDLPMSKQHIATLARSLSGTLDEKGYLLIHAQSPLSIGHKFSGGFGNVLEGARVGVNRLALDAYVSCGHLLSAWSTPHVMGGGQSATVAWCVDRVLSVQASGTAAFRELSLHGLQITPLKPASGSVTTPARVVSATFITPDHGWLLQQNGAIGVTTDGGTTWRPLATLGRAGADMEIRFADELHGFAFSRFADAESSLLTTDDGGNSWTPLDTPFAKPLFDLAISRGVVYVVAMRPVGGEIGIWSTPASKPRWVQDPLTIPVGGGPVPSAQFAFSDGIGRLIVNNRVVAGGALLSANGHWTMWTPPCLGTGGSARLASSTATDLVALCNEGVWSGSGRLTIGVYFSHDDGATFARHDAPKDGELASPDRDIAVILVGNELQRTTDDGTTWHVAYTEQSEAGSGGELGFTSATQGYAVLQDGAMVMTYDAGATWQRVTLP